MAELADTKVTVNAFRPGIVDTAIHEWIRSQPAERIGEGLRSQFIKFQQAGSFISPEHSAAALIARLGGDTTGQIWDVDDEKPLMLSTRATGDHTQATALIPDAHWCGNGFGSRWTT